MTDPFPRVSKPAVFPTSQPVKLASLFTLSAGALAFAPEAGDQIIWSGVVDAKIGFGSGDSISYTVDLPGADDLKIGRINSNGRYVSAHRTGTALNLVIQRNATGTALDFFKAAAAGQKWGTLGGLAGNYALLVLQGSGTGTRGPGTYNHLYALFRFADTTAGNALRYGWLDLSGLGGSGPDIPTLTLHSWAYDASGAEIPAGFTAVPEPQATSLVTGTALVLGAAGVRAWRRKRAAVG